MERVFVRQTKRGWQADRNTECASGTARGVGHGLRAGGIRNDEERSRGFEMVQRVCFEQRDEGNEVMLNADFWVFY